jgi:uncharacterized protein YkwD
VSRSAERLGVLMVVGAITGGALSVSALAGPNGVATVHTPAERIDAPDTVSGPLAELLQSINAERARRGVAPLVWNAQLALAAQVQSDDMATHNRVDHTGTDGSNAGQRLSAAGFDWTGWGENLAAGQSTVAALFEDWMQSESHRPQLVGAWTYVGIAVAISSLGIAYWTLVVATGR